MDAFDLLRAFIETRKEVAVKRLDAQVATYVVRAQEAEAVCLALELLDRVLGVMRDCVSDEEAVDALMKCVRLEDRPSLLRLPFKPSHPYEPGFTGSRPGTW